MGEAITSKSHLVINNINTLKLPGAWGNCIEGFGPAEKNILTLQALAKEGLGAKAHCCRNYHGTNDPCSWENVQNGLAAFLIGAGENAFFACGDSFEMGPWIKWFPEYDKPLGRPLGDGVKGKDGVWTRSFESGTTVRFTPGIPHKKDGIGKITWGSSPPTPPSPSPTPPSPTPPLPPSPSECGTCKVCFNPANHKCQDQGPHRPKTKSACEAKHHMWCGPATVEEYV